MVTRTGHIGVVILLCFIAAIPFINHLGAEFNVVRFLATRMRPGMKSA